MTEIKEIEQRIRRLSRNELTAFRDWFLSYDAEAWDRQIERDAAAGRLDELADEARGAHEAGRTKPL
ncbi:MAG: hypothetical protein WEB85_08150 [Dongiaceae bacterium]